MKRLGAFAFVLALFAVVAPLEAQRGGPGGGRGPTVDEQIVALTDALSLTDEQVVSVRAVLEMATERRQEMFAGGPPDDRDAMRAAMMELREDTDTQLGEILSEDQMEKYAELMAQRRQARRPPF
jgi:hypothetical protein